MSTIAAAGVVDRDRESSMRWAVVGLLSLGMVIAYIDRVNLTAAMPVIGTTFGLDKTQQGLALSAFFWTYTLFQIPCGLLVDRYGVRMPYFIGFLAVVAGVGRDRDDLGADVARGPAAHSRDRRSA